MLSLRAIRIKDNYACDSTKIIVIFTGFHVLISNKSLHLCTPKSVSLYANVILRQLEDSGFANTIRGPVVQWIEYKIPVLKIWVRFPSGLQLTIRNSTELNTKKYTKAPFNMCFRAYIHKLKFQLIYVNKLSLIFINYSKTRL